jgi:hypothetical protein
MTQAQKARIEATPFKWLMRLPKKLKICGILLDELVKRWNHYKKIAIYQRTVLVTVNIP